MSGDPTPDEEYIICMEPTPQLLAIEGNEPTTCGGCGKNLVISKEGRELDASPRCLDCTLEDEPDAVPYGFPPNVRDDLIEKFGEDEVLAFEKQYGGKTVAEMAKILAERKGPGWTRRKVG